MTIEEQQERINREQAEESGDPGMIYLYLLAGGIIFCMVGSLWSMFRTVSLLY